MSVPHCSHGNAWHMFYVPRCLEVVHASAVTWQHFQCQNPPRSFNLRRLQKRCQSTACTVIGSLRAQFICSWCARIASRNQQNVIYAAVNPLWMLITCSCRVPTVVSWVLAFTIFTAAKTSKHQACRFDTVCFAGAKLYDSPYFFQGYCYLHPRAIWSLRHVFCMWAKHLHFVGPRARCALGLPRIQIECFCRSHQSWEDVSILDILVMLRAVLNGWFHGCLLVGLMVV